MHFDWSIPMITDAQLKSWRIGFLMVNSFENVDKIISKKGSKNCVV